MPRPLLIVNPFASRVTDEAVARVARALGDVDVVETERPGHATELARGARERVYVFSGDGGFNEVLNGIGADVAVGLIPGGGASVLPRALGLPRDPVRAAARVREGTRRRIGVGRANGRRFGFAAGIGLDAELVRRVDGRGRTRERGRAGNWTFALEAARVLAERRFRLDPALEIAGAGRAAFALVANGSPYTYAGPLPLRVAPRASFDGGLDLVAPVRVRPAALPRLAYYALAGRGQDRTRDVVYVHDADRIEVRCDRPLPLQVDGEDVGDVESVRFEAERRAVAVLV